MAGMTSGYRYAGGLLFVLVLAFATIGAARPAQAAEALPTMLGVDWRAIFDGAIDQDGHARGFTAPGPSGYPRSCSASTNSCPRTRCCSGRCDAWADGQPSETAPWLATVHIRSDCRSAWVRLDSTRMMFPSGWPEARIKATILSAYKAGRALPARGDLWCGCAGDMTVFGRQSSGLITAAWPSPDQACGCEKVPLHKR